MHTIKLWNCFHLSIFKINIILLLIIFSAKANAQTEKMNNPEHDEKLYYFGITVGLNSAQYKVSHSNYFLENDSVMQITPLWRPGFQLGIVGNLKLSNFIDVRAIPTFVLREEALKFQITKDSVLTNSSESILFSLPIEFKFKSERQTNFRFYVCAGGKIDYDFNANSTSKRTGDIIRTKPFDYGYNLGLGFEFFFPNFIFAPEIKLSNGLGNTLYKNYAEPTNKAIDKISTRMIVIGIHLEG